MTDLHTAAKQLLKTWDADELIHANMETLRQALANETLDKKADNARELGLDYEPVENYCQECLTYNGHQEGCSQALAEQPARQEPVAWRNAALRVGEDLCSVGPFGYYDMTAEQWLDWALSVVTVHEPPRPQAREPEQPAQPQYDKTEMNKFVQELYDQKMREGKHGHYETMFHVVHRAIEAAHGIKENT